MNRRRVRSDAAAVALALVVAGCDGDGPQVAFNQRTFILPERILVHSECLIARLTGSGRGQPQGGLGTQSLLMTARVANHQLLVEVKEGRTLLLRRSYDEPFLRSGQVDEFEIVSTRGDGMRVRNWGSFGPDGRPECAPREDASTQQP